ncbi:MAG: hypothetical protein INR69_16545 [Mucilaginibacter polytrichastri]|nr:hypothetical protein [Mucilaginibacter polytrichastri]
MNRKNLKKWMAEYYHIRTTTEQLESAGIDANDMYLAMDDLQKRILQPFGLPSCGRYLLLFAEYYYGDTIRSSGELINRLQKEAEIFHCTPVLSLEEALYKAYCTREDFDEIFPIYNIVPSCYNVFLYEEILMKNGPDHLRHIISDLRISEKFNRILTKKYIVKKALSSYEERKLRNSGLHYLEDYEQFEDTSVAGFLPAVPERAKAEMFDFLRAMQSPETAEMRSGYRGRINYAGNLGSIYISMDDDTLCYTVFLPLNIPQQALPELNVLLNLINQDIASGTFCIDNEGKTVLYKSSVCICDVQNPALIGFYLRRTHEIPLRWLPEIAAFITPENGENPETYFRWKSEAPHSKNRGENGSGDDGEDLPF